MLINYSVVSLVPCLVRDERINVGVVVWAANPSAAPVDVEVKSAFSYPVVVRMVDSLDETVLGRALPESMRSSYTRVVSDLKKRLEGESGDNIGIMSAHMNNLLQLTPPQRMASTSGNLAAEADESCLAQPCGASHSTRLLTRIVNHEETQIELQ